ncbi:hypothetical protein SAY87_026100 [Trapa incisa]|uniref:BRCT domain-containing protein n=1 Tax=Trapa incisa TaxID=236973 RepID=A0AAN7GUE1_9MYRT|nr:hypothetical protein SAY87_026100 [Trapa incisa]
MSHSKSSPEGSDNKTAKRNLPLWMGSRQENSCNLTKKTAGSEENKDNELSSRVKNEFSNFSKLLEGVVFVLSGFVNPERSTLRSQALEMGAVYQPDWSSDCTLLVCAFRNTPKFRQVEADNGTIVSKEWISECYSQKRLVEIDVYLMHAGNPWRRSNLLDKTVQIRGIPPGRNSHQKLDKESSSKKSTSSRVCSIHSSNILFKFQSNPLPNKCTIFIGIFFSLISWCFIKALYLPMLCIKCMLLLAYLLCHLMAFELQDRIPDLPEYLPSPSRVKTWVSDDLNKTISWLGSQEEKPKDYEIKKIASQGILTCLQDAIDALEHNQEIHGICEQWNILPRVVEEVLKIKGSKSCSPSILGECIKKWIVNCKTIYEDEYRRLDEGSGEGNSGTRGSLREEEISKHLTEYDSDETIEMTEEEIDLAFNRVTSKVPRCF